MSTLAEALSLASSYWETKRGNTGEVMPMRAATCVALLDASRSASSLGQADAIHVLAGLKAKGLSAASQASYYAAFRRMLALAGVSTLGWPSAPTPPRRKARPSQTEQLVSLEAWLREQGWVETADLLLFLRGTGCRVRVEALDWEALKVSPCGGFLEVTGKGGHTRTIPIGADTAELVRATERLVSMRRLSYDGHLKRWNLGKDALGLETKVTPHGVRHWYATEAFKRAGGNLRVVQELLGHADVSTTAGYVGVDMAELAQAAGVAEQEG